MSSGIELHPLLVLFGVLAGDSIAGIPGMFFSVPVIAILRVIYTNLRRAYIHRQFSDGISAGVKTAKPPDLPGGLLVEPQTIEK
jgi:predicted PurR-regulated permease PerM